jgi:hypothetical protein
VFKARVFHHQALRFVQVQKVTSVTPFLQRRAQPLCGEDRAKDHQGYKLNGVFARTQPTAGVAPHAVSWTTGETSSVYWTGKPVRSG